MKRVYQSKAWYALVGICAIAVFMLGTALWHILLDAGTLDNSMKGIIGLFVPDRSDWYIHFISYILMAPLMSAMFLWFRCFRKQWVHTSVLTSNLALLTARNARLDKLAYGLGLKNKVFLLDSDDYFSFCAFCFHPRIYVSRAMVEMLENDELEALLLHERYHLENYDPLKIFSGQLMVSAFFFIPIMKDLFKNYLVTKEVNADSSAVRYQANRRGIMGALQKLLVTNNAGEPAAFAVSGTDTLEYRIEHLVGGAYKQRISLSHIAVSLLMLFLVIGSLLASFAAMGR